MRLLSWIFLCVVSLFASGCLQTENSNSDDATATGTPQFIAAVSVLSSNCIGCHEEFQNKTADELVASGFVIPGDPENSSIYYRMRNSAGSEGPKTMPPSGALSAEDIQAISTWIESITP